jgi:flagellar hook protein FlgE
MLRSLFSGISGLRAHQQMMDVTGNNIANVNSVGYKSAQTVFQDTLSQMMKAAGAPQDEDQGGTNPAQVGLGVRMAGINTNFTQGSAQNTGRPTDLMISGDGFFVVESVGEQLFTRAGAFNFDADGKLVNLNGAAVQGWMGQNGVVNTNGQLTDIRLPVGTMIAPTATEAIETAGNLPAQYTVADPPIVRTITTYNSSGTEVPVTITYAKTAAGWDVTVDDALSAPVTVPITFATPDGPPNTSTVTLVRPLPDPPVVVDIGKLSNFTGDPTVAVLGQNGAPAATLTSFSINPNGELVGVFSNGLKQTVAQLAMANFNNPAGLEKVGDAMYRFTVNSGLAQVGEPGSSGLGTLQAGAVEMSNVDLAQEFTSLIVAQRGFQANSKVISTSDDLLQELVNLKR